MKSSSYQADALIEVAYLVSSGFALINAHVFTNPTGVPAKSRFGKFGADTLKLPITPFF
jgi:hypothetical protein